MCVCSHFRSLHLNSLNIPTKESEQQRKKIVFVLLILFHRWLRPFIYGLLCIVTVYLYLLSLWWCCAVNDMHSSQPQRKNIWKRNVFVFVCVCGILKHRPAAWIEHHALLCILWYIRSRWTHEMYTLAQRSLRRVKRYMRTNMPCALHQVNRTQHLFVSKNICIFYSAAAHRVLFHADKSMFDFSISTWYE